MGRAGRTGRVMGSTLGFTLLRPSSTFMSLKRVVPQRRGLALPRTRLTLAERRLPLHVRVPLGRHDSTWELHD